MSQGATAQQSAEAFLEAQIELLPVQRDDLMFDDRGGFGHIQPVMYLPETDSYKFTAVYYQQHRGGVPVYGGRLILLTRNEPGFPLVLANTDVRDIGNFQPQAAGLGAPAARQAQGVMLERFEALKQAGVEPAVIAESSQVIWAGLDSDLQAPRLANVATVNNEIDAWRIITDASTGAVLHEEHLICFVDINGTVAGLVTEGVATAECEAEVGTGLPWLLVNSDSQTTSTDADGNYSFTGLPQAFLTVSSTLVGLYFEIFDWQVSVASETESANPPLVVDLLFNAANNDEFVRAQVNAYYEANVVRDAGLQANPTYPGINHSNFPVTVNRTDGFCPSNAWFNSAENSINFCASSGSSNPNTAWASVVHHEYGHYYVQLGNAGAQGQFGEGFGDVMSTILLDSNRLGAGWAGNCLGELRNADNTIQYPCTGAIHTCGQLLSGCVWDTRNELVITEPANYQDILMDLALNAVLLHSGSTITPSITLDWLTLDDDNGVIGDGTPHYMEIALGFGAHNMPAPELEAITFSFPSGLPDKFAPGGTTTVPVVVEGVLGTPDPGSASMFFDNGSGSVEIAMTETSPNNYLATLPATDCGDFASFYFQAQDTGGTIQTSPPLAPGDQYSALAAIDLVESFADDFESDTGWTVTQLAATGNWNRCTPGGFGDRGDNPFDADGSGQCYNTDCADGDTDVDNGSTTLQSPMLDASDPNALIEYWRWYSNDFGGNPNQDVFEVEVSSNNGGSWVVLETVGPGGTESNGGWFQVQYKISDYVASTANFRIRFTATDDVNGSVVEAAVDGVKIIVLDCEDETCLGDFDGSGSVDVSDLLGMLSLWGACSGCPEDLNSDGQVNVADLLDLLARWGLCS
jgi:hypothetical protein